MNGRESSILRTAPLALTLIAAMGLVACSGDDDGTTAPKTAGGKVLAIKVPTANGKGGFFVKVAGDYTGTGTANVSGSSISITISPVKDSNGNVGSLTANGQLTDNVHFRATGSVLNQSIIMEGRAEAQDPSIRNISGPKSEKVIINDRVSATFHTTDNQHFGRIVGARGNARHPTD